MKKRPNPQEAVDLFNARVPVGAEVSVVRDDKTATVTKTTSAAYVLGGHTAVIMLEGISGCFLLSRVSPITRKV